ncbi:dromyosuppressin [Phlebotomus argentipes]|uniref:dromyosuppressin n=1 Tax=Phlebotomus argentipes TaxID=94469 RepID=UPI0028932102|nr:dromyosuppressin [Phlebotomus argentipes]
MHQLLLLLLALAAVQATPIPQLCDPAVVEEMPPHIKKVCVALENSNQLSSALSAFLRAETSALMFRPEDLASLTSAQLGGKRTDVDHVFLRFGRR